MVMHIGSVQLSEISLSALKLKCRYWFSLADVSEQCKRRQHHYFSGKIFTISILKKAWNN